MKWLIIGATAAVFAAFILITWIQHKRSQWPKKPQGFEWPGALARWVSALIIAVSAWVRHVSKWLWAWFRKSRWLKAKAKKAPKIAAVALIAGVTIVLFAVLGGAISLATTVFALSWTMPKISFGGSKTIVLFISFFVIVGLIFGLIARETKKRKAYTTPATEKKYSETKLKKAVPKWTQNLGWLTLPLIIGLILFLGGAVKPEIAKGLISILAGLALVAVAFVLVVAIKGWIGKNYKNGAPKKTLNLNLGWLGKAAWTTLVLALLGTFVLWLVKPGVMEPVKRWAEKRFPSSSTVDTLYCGTDGYIKLPMKSEVMMVVMPSVDTTAVDDTTDYSLEPGEEGYNGEGNWTDWLARPWGAREMWVEPHEEIEAQDRFADGRIGEPFFDDPTLRLTVDDLQRADDDLTGVRFRNLGEKPIKVTIYLR